MEQVELTEGEYDLMGRLCNFASSRLAGEQSIYQAAMFSKSQDCPVFLLIAFGEDALRIQGVIQRATVAAPEGMIEIVSNSIKPGNH